MGSRCRAKAPFFCTMRRRESSMYTFWFKVFCTNSCQSAADLKKSRAKKWRVHGSKQEFVPSGICRARFLKANWYPSKKAPSDENTDTLPLS